MKIFSTPRVLVSLIAISSVSAQDLPRCGNGMDPCPEEYPCCSLEGTCGNGYVCLGGCEPRFSFTPGACMPMPQCKSFSQKFSSLDDITPYEKYLGDADKQPWSYLGNITEVDNKVRAQLYRNGPGTTISSSHYMWYGKATIKLKSSNVPGIISTFILLSSVGDEVDYEIMGYNKAVETNWYWHLILNNTNMEVVGTPDPTVTELEYVIDWTEDKIDWLVNGELKRTLHRNDVAFNETVGAFQFPQTPSRVQFGLWAGGDSPSPGTSEWAGGKVNWDAALEKDGYVYVEVSSVDIECYGPKQPVGGSGSRSWVYVDRKGIQKSIENSDNTTIIDATDGTGLNPKGSGGEGKGKNSVRPPVTLSREPTSSRSVATLSGASRDSTSSSEESSSSRKVISLGGSSTQKDDSSATATSGSAKSAGQGSGSATKSGAEASSKTHKEASGAAPGPLAFNLMGTFAAVAMGVWALV